MLHNFSEPAGVFAKDSKVDVLIGINSLGDLVEDRFIFQNPLEFLECLTAIDINFESRVLYDFNRILFHINQANRSQPLNIFIATSMTMS